MRLKLSLISLVILTILVACGEGSSQNNHENVDYSTFKIDFLEYGKVKISWDEAKGSNTYKVKYFPVREALYWELLSSETISSPNIILYGITEEEWMIAIKPNNGITWTLTKFVMSEDSAYIYTSDTPPTN